MLKRTCAACGKEKEIKSGAICEKGHFICYFCKYIKGFLSDTKRTKCPVCDTSLR
jgi:hypothetical protein